MNVYPDLKGEDGWEILGGFFYRIDFYKSYGDVTNFRYFFQIILRLLTRFIVEINGDMQIDSLKM